jgi:hypothetical protein
MAMLLSCQKEYINLGAKPKVSLTVPLLNQDVHLSNFGMDTIAYGTNLAFSLPLGSGNGTRIPLGVLNRSLTSTFQSSSNVINTVWGSLNQERELSLDTLISLIQNPSLAATFNQAILSGLTPPIISQALLRPKELTIGESGGGYSSPLPLELTVTLENFQNANIQLRFQAVTTTDSVVSSQINIPAGATQSTTIQLPSGGDLPILISIINITISPLGTLYSSNALYKMSIDINQDFTQFDSKMDSAVWLNSYINFPYLDSLSFIAPRFEIHLNNSSNFFFNTSTNLGTSMRRRISNLGQTFVDMPVAQGQTNQYSVGGSTLFGNRDTFEFQSVYYSLNSSIPNLISSRFISTTDVHAFNNPIYSKLSLNSNIPLFLRQQISSSLSLPYIDSAEFYDAIINVRIEGDEPYELEFQLNGINYPHGNFLTDSIQKTLVYQNLESHKEFFTFDSSNSHLNSLTILPFDSIVIAPKLKILGSSKTYTITEESQLLLYPELIVPMQGTFRRIVYSDTIILDLDTTILNFALRDTLRINFASSNPATLGFSMKIQLIDSLSNVIEDQSDVLIDPSPYSETLINGLNYVTTNSSYFILKEKIKRSKQLVYILTIGGDSDNRIRLPASGVIRLEANLVIQ